MTFAALVRSRLMEKKISLRELCRRSGMDPSLLSKALAGKRNPPSDDGTLTRLARALDISPAELFVSAGKIPREWRRIQADKKLFENVRLVMEHSPALSGPRPARPSPYPLKGGGGYRRGRIKAGKTAGALPSRENAAAEPYKQQRLAEELL